MIKLLYIPTLNVPVCYWRIESYAQKLVNFSNQVTVHVEYFDDHLHIEQSWEDACIGKGDLSNNIQSKLRSAFRFFDVIIFQRMQDLKAIALVEEFRREFPDTKIVAELDDSVGEISVSSPYKWKEHHRWSAEHIHRSDAVICSTQYLADSIKFITKDKPVLVAPNCINRDIWKFEQKERNHSGFKFGYVGGGGHNEDLLMVYRAILPILDKNKHVQFVIRSGGYKPSYLKDHPQIDFKSVAWKMDEYPQQLSDLNIDVGLAPLRDSEFNRCKSNLKWLEWSSLGVPVLASNVEPYIRTKESGCTIYLVEDNSVESWRNDLNSFVSVYSKEKDNEKRLKKQNIKHHNIRIEAKKVLKFVKSLL